MLLCFVIQWKIKKKKCDVFLLYVGNSGALMFEKEKSVQQKCLNINIIFFVRVHKRKIQTDEKQTIPGIINMITTSKTFNILCVYLPKTSKECERDG